MFSLTTCNEFARRFKDITGQNVEDWSSYEFMVAAGKHHEPMVVGECIDNIIVSEICRVCEENFQASYVRDLATLLVELRAAML